MKSAPRLVATVLGFACVAAVLPISAAPAKPLNPSFSCWWSEPFDEFEVSPAGAKFFGAETLDGSGTIPKTVTGVADADKLNVRALPSASSKIVATIPPRGSVWIYPQKAKNGWLKVSAICYPPKESGFVTVVDGWVNSSFVSK
jgi:uncharacterized protein YgiM (DUF1202 family)